MAKTDTDAAVPVAQVGQEKEIVQGSMRPAAIGDETLKSNVDVDDVAFPLKPKRDKIPAKSFIALCAGLAALLLAAILPMGDVKLHSYTPFLHLDDSNLQKYKGELVEASKKMEERWQQASPVVQTTFTKFFIPSPSENEQLPVDPLQTVRSHISRMLECKVPFSLNTTGRKDYALQMRLLTSLCIAVVDRLDEVEEMLQQNERVGVPVPIEGLDERYAFPSLEELEGTYNPKMPAVEFFTLMGVTPSLKPEELAELPEVDRCLGDTLVNLLKLERQRIDHNRSALEAFAGSLGSFEGPFHLSPAKKVDFVIPYTGTTFKTSILGDFFQLMYPDHFSTPRNEFHLKLHRIGRMWSSESVLEAAKKQQEDFFKAWSRSINLKRSVMQDLMGKNVHRDDLLMYCIFIL
ncbi:hypothetical protein, conserved [Eimeria maxima]|uniref:Uncharacterized protein n=1 Tax=Eimeria maxima TaxID=5804 RepID=U6M8P8_EIMMA|nr:hypothetical protein, conserved [Eimeria maxima]CDJ60552.1 hypothetical protein, conserved [Eimeria maxima]